MIYLVYSKINRYNQPYQLISRIMKYQPFVINIINLLEALYLISIKLFLILISKLVPLTQNCKDSKYVYLAAVNVITGNLKIMSDSRTRSIIANGPKYRFPAKKDFQKCREKNAASFNEYCNRWCKRKHVECDVLKD